MTGYQWTPSAIQPNAATLIALLRHENQQLRKELAECRATQS